jgi:serine/threonine protein phosphatase PrpC
MPQDYLPPIKIAGMSKRYFATAGKSAVGMVRAGNEDSAVTSNFLVAVADGMGGHAAGEVASKIAIRAISTIAKSLQSKEMAEEEIDELLAKSIMQIDGALANSVDENPSLAGMGTTLSALFLRDGSIALLHIGDSRIYRLRGNTFEQLTVDHTVIQELLDQGAITESEIATHPQRSVLTQVLMGEGRHLPALITLDIKAEDRFLLCSDGLTGVVADKEIKAILKGKGRGTAVDALIEAAHINGAPDNVTVIVADILENDIQEPESYLGAAK